jgi:hypothetical protein
MLLKFWFFFVLRFVCLPFVQEFGGKNILTCWKWKDVYYYFLYGFFFSNQELKENKTLHLKGETFHMLCHFTRLDWNKQLLFFKDNHNWLFCFCKFCLCCVLFKYQKCGVDFGNFFCLYYLKAKRMRKRKLLDVILFILGFWLVFVLFKFKMWPSVWNCFYFLEEEERKIQKWEVWFFLNLEI